MPIRPLKCSKFVLLAAATILGVCSLAAQEDFTITDLGTLGGAFSLAYGVNDHGDAVGESWLADGSTHAFLWSEGRMTDLGTLSPDHYSIAFAVNNRRQVVGYSSNGTVSLPFLWENGTMTALPLLPNHRYGSAWGLNNNGDVVGDSEGDAVRWANGVVTRLGGATYSSAHGINDRGQIVGYASLPGTGWNEQAVIWDNGVMVPLAGPVVPGCPAAMSQCASIARAINEQGDISGGAVSSPDSKNHAVRWSNGIPTVLKPFANSTDSLIHNGSINEAGEIAGTSIVQGDEATWTIPTVWSNGEARALPTLFPFDPAAQALSIGSGGHIAGGMSVSVGLHAVLWIPVAKDLTPPQVTVIVHGGTIWPPNGQMVPVTFTGTVTDDGPLGVVTFEIQDEYGRTQPSGNVTLMDGHFTITVLLEASRLGTDRDGRLYVLIVRAADEAGNRGIGTATATVPHDRR